MVDCEIKFDEPPELLVNVIVLIALLDNHVVPLSQYAYPVDAFLGDAIAV